MSGHADGTKNTHKKPNNLTVDPKADNSRPGSSSQGVPGLAELLSVIETIAATPIGRNPAIGDGVVSKLRTTPLYAAYVALQPVIMKIYVSETTVEARSPWKLAHESREEIPHLKPLETGIEEVNKTVNAISKNGAKGEDVASGFRTLAERGDANRHAVLGAVSASTAGLKGGIEGLHGEVETINGSLESGFGDLKDQLDRLQQHLVQDAKERVTNLQGRVTELEARNGDLERALETISSVLSPLKEVLEMAVNGKFGDASASEANSSSQGARHVRRLADVTLLAQIIRNRVLRLYSQCEALFSIIFPHSPPQIQELQDEYEGSWLEAMETISDLHSELRAAAESGDRRSQRLQFFQFVIDQMRHGRYSPGQWAEEMKGQDLKKFMSTSFNGFASIRALAEDIQRLRKNYKILEKKLTVCRRLLGPAGHL